MSGMRMLNLLEWEKETCASEICQGSSGWSFALLRVLVTFSPHITWAVYVNTDYEESQLNRVDVVSLCRIMLLSFSFSLSLSCLNCAHMHKCCPSPHNEERENNLIYLSPYWDQAMGWTTRESGFNF
jgi:hypothetical protein